MLADQEHDLFNLLYLIILQYFSLDYQVISKIYYCPKEQLQILDNH
jgi:hypothetical protein